MKKSYSVTVAPFQRPLAVRTVAVLFRGCVGGTFPRQRRRELTNSLLPLGCPMASSLASRCARQTASDGAALNAIRSLCSAQCSVLDLQKGKKNAHYVAFAAMKLVYVDSKYEDAIKFSSLRGAYAYTNILKRIVCIHTKLKR